MSQWGTGLGDGPCRSKIAGGPYHRAEVRVSLIDTTRCDADASMRLLDKGERERASNLVRASDREAFVATRAALRRLLGRDTRIPPSELRFDTSALGKPELAREHGSADIGFSVTHTEGLSLIAIAPCRAIGVDIEIDRLVGQVELIAAKAFDGSVAGRLRCLPASVRSTAFLRCWTAGEAFGKATGLGIAGLGGRFPMSLSSDLSTACITAGPPARPGFRWSVAPLDVGPGYIATLVYESGADELPHVRLLAKDHPVANLSEPRL